MTVPTKQEMLDAVENAIQAKMLGGAVQSYSISGRNIQSMTLKELRDWRDQLTREISAAAGGGRTHVKFADTD